MSFPFLIEHICKVSSRLTKGNLLKYSDNGVASRHACSSSQCCFSKFDEHPGHVMRMGFTFAIILYSEELITDKLHN